MEEYSYELKIPKERVAVLIGKDGNIKKKLEQLTNCHINIDSKEGEITIRGEDTLGLFDAREIVKAVARGFNPEVAFLLLKSDYSLEILHIHDYAGKSKDKALKLKGRVIGKEGSTRETLEKLSNTMISVYGKTISIIGRIEDVMAARKAVESLLAGAPHANVYRALEIRRKELRNL